MKVVGAYLYNSLEISGPIQVWSCICQFNKFGRSENTQSTNQATWSFIFALSGVLSQPKHGDKIETIFENVICQFQRRIGTCHKTLTPGFVFLTLVLPDKFPFVVPSCHRSFKHNWISVNLRPLGTAAYTTALICCKNLPLLWVLLEFNNYKVYLANTLVIHSKYCL